MNRLLVMFFPPSSTKPNGDSEFLHFIRSLSVNDVHDVDSRQMKYVRASLIILNSNKRGKSNLCIYYRYKLNITKYHYYGSFRISAKVSY